jgi:5-methylcytosine-specific restriction protein B
MKNNNYISIGWEAIGDIKDIETRENIVQKLTELKLYNESHQIIGRKANEIFNFYSVMRIGDIILAQDGYKIRGIGKIDGNYIYQKNLDFPNLRPVKWLFNDNINIINKEGNLTTFIEIKDKNTIDKINNYILGKPSLSRGIKMEHKFLNTILHGAPGTGKTWNTIDRAVAIATKTSLEENISEEKHAEKFEIFNKLLWDGKNKTGQICFITFHQSYSYEEFVEGLKPKTENGNIKYEFEDGIFKQLCDKAKNDSPNNYVLIIDEINRGNVSRIFGELITLIEPDKRENVIKDEDDKTKYNTLRVTLPYSKVQFSVPNNLYIIGTMNTADRSIEALDTALRRRFSFVEYEPKYDLVELKISIDGVSLSEILKTINKRIEILYDRDHWIGHSYFLDVKDKKDLINVFNDKVIPLLKEYFFSDWGKIRLILGNDFIEKEEIKEKKKYFNITDTDYDYSDKILYKLKNTEDDKNNWNFNEFHYSNNETDNN